MCCVGDQPLGRKYTSCTNCSASCVVAYYWPAKCQVFYNYKAAPRLRGSILLDAQVVCFSSRGLLHSVESLDNLCLFHNLLSLAKDVTKSA